MLGLQQGQHLPRIVVIHEPVLQDARIIVTLRTVNAEPLITLAEPFCLVATNAPNSDLFTELSRVSQRKEIDRWTSPMSRHSHLNMPLFTQ